MGGFVVDSGKIVPNIKNSVGWNLHRGKGSRTFSERIKFSKEFKKGVKPQVICFISSHDVATGYDHRINVFPSNVNEKGATINVNTWNDTKVFGVVVTWICVDSIDDTIVTGMTRFRNADKGYCLDEDDGARSHSLHVKFDSGGKSFSGNPIVFASFSMLDVSNDSDHRVALFCHHIKKEGFDISLGTWNDTCVYGANVVWFAYDNKYSSHGLHGISIKSGGKSFQKNDAGYSLLEGAGDRSNKRRIDFEGVSFSQSPSVCAGLSLLDVLNEADHRIYVLPENVEKNSFQIKISTWNDSKIWSGSGNWLAFAPAKKVEKRKRDDESDEDEKEPPKKKKKVADDDDDDDEATMCKICFDAKINSVIIPCGHLCVCFDCSKMLKNKKCPICKSKISSIIKTFVA